MKVEKSGFRSPNLVIILRAKCGLNSHLSSQELLTFAEPGFRHPFLGKIPRNGPISLCDHHHTDLRGGFNEWRFHNKSN
jgi:hypothetical protein